MSRQKKEAVAGRETANVASAGTPQTAFRHTVRWLPAPRKRPIVLGILAALYLVWLLALAGMAMSAL